MGVKTRISVRWWLLALASAGVWAGLSRSAPPQHHLSVTTSRPVALAAGHNPGAPLWAEHAAEIGSLSRRPRRGRGIVYTVTTTADSGAGSLRAAMTSANASAGLDTIEFGIPGNAPFVISLASSLPAVTEEVTIDGTAQSGYAGTPLVQINGPASGTVFGITGGAGTSLLGLAIDNVNGDAVAIGGNGSNVLVYGCWIGLSLSGNSGGVSGVGVRITDTPGNAVGSLTPVEGCVLGNCAGGAVRISGTAATNNAVLGSRIGLDTQDQPAPNLYGVYIASPLNLVAGCTLSGNTQYGVYLDTSAANNNVVRANRIGTNAAGSVAVPNGSHGVFVANARGTTIGGVTAAEGNDISGNGGDGVAITGASATQNSVDCNAIGTNTAGTAAIPNARGISLAGGANLTLIGSYNAERPNLIAHNTGAGIVVTGNSVNNPFPNNSFYANGGLSVDLGGDGVTANDSGDADDGPNHVVNYPVITAATTTGSTLRVGGTLDSPVGTSSYPHTVLVYSVDDAADPSGHGEAKTLIGQINVDAPGNFVADLASTVAIGDYVCAATVDHSANQSEFSANVMVTGDSVVPLHLGFVSQPADAVAGATMAPVTVEILDGSNQRVTTDTRNVSLALTPGTLSTLSGTTTVAAVAGLATFNTLSMVDAGSFTVDASAAGVSGATSSSFAITPGAPLAGSCLMIADKTSVLADGTDSVALSVVLRDSHGNLVPGADATRVHVSASPSTGVTITQPTGVTNSLGRAIATASRTTAGTVNFSASLDGNAVPVSVNVDFAQVTVSPSLSTLTADAATRLADGVDAATLTITVQDASGHAMVGVAAAEVVVSGTPTTGLQITQPTAATDASGRTTATATCTTAGTVTFSVRVRGVTVTATAQVAYQTGAVSAGQSALAVTPTSLTADGTDTATITVTARDAGGNALAGIAADQVVLAVTPSTGITLTQPTTATNASGQTAGSLRGTAVGTVTVSVTIGGTAITQTVQVGLVPTGIDTAASGVAAAASTAVADGLTPLALTITVLDANGSPLSGIAAGRLGVVASPSTGVTLTQPTSATDAQGQTTVSAVVSTAGMVTFSATIDGGALGQTAQVTFSASAPDPARCSLAASKTSALADGSDAVTFTATIVDANGTALSDLAGTRLALAVDIASGVTWGSFGATDANGRAAATVTSTRSGSRSFQLWLDGQPAGAPVSVSFVAGPVAAATSTLTANKATAVANGQDSIILTLTLRDAQGNAKPGVAASAVSFTSTGGAGSGLTLTPPSVVSDASGRMTLSAKATVPQSVTLQVAIGSATWSQSVAFTAQQPSPSRSTVSLSPAVIAADGAEQATLSVRLVDVNGLAVVGSPASARSVASSVVSVTVADAGAESDAGGQFAMKLTARTAGTTQVTLTVAGVRLAPVTLTVSGYADLSLAAGLQFVGLPLTPRADAWTALTGVTGVDARAWDAASQTYVLPGMSYTPGTGLWVASDGARAQRVLGQATANAVQRLPLRRGWNALANPFGGAVSWDLANIGVEVSGAVVGNLADTSLWTTRVAPYGWLYSADGGYRLLGDRSVPEFASATGALPAMAGFWLHAETDGVTLLLPPPGLARAGRAQVAPTAADWTLALTARQDTVAGQAVVGVSSRLSRALPLALPPQVDGTDQPLLTLLAQGDARLAGQVQTGGTAAHTWDLLVTSTSRAPVELSWPGLGRALPGSLVLELTDDAGTTLLNTRSAWRWQPAGPGEAKRLRLTARLGHITRSAVTSLGLRGSRGAGQSIALTLAAPADVVVTVRGLGGRLVRELRASCGVGPTALAWDGTDAQGRPVPAGTYRLEAQAIAANGAVDRAVRTVTLP